MYPSLQFILEIADKILTNAAETYHLLHKERFCNRGSCYIFLEVHACLTLMSALLVDFHEIL